MYLEKSVFWSYINSEKNRQETALTLEKYVNEELQPLKLEDANFRVNILSKEEQNWNASGGNSVSFLVRLNKGSNEGEIHKVSSGGELSRLMLAVNLVLADSLNRKTLIFDEVDAGIGGAVAAAVGERLAKLSEDIQVLTITHSPQVAAYGLQHLKISKSEKNGSIVTQVTELDKNEKNEEIARMLAGVKITDEARAAAASLLFRGTP